MVSSSSSSSLMRNNHAIILVTITVLIALCSTLFIIVADAIYLPGAEAVNYKKSDAIGVKVIRLDSINTQIPIDYYSLPFCRPSTVTDSSDSLGEALSGDRIENSLYKVIVDMEETCQIVCRMVYNDNDLSKLSDAIKEEYRVNWLLDNLPAATKFFTQRTAEIGAGDAVETAPAGDASIPVNPSSREPYEEHYDKGFSLGFTGNADIANSIPGVRYINNHLRLTVHYHVDAEQYKGSRIVGFEVQPFSVAHSIVDNAAWHEPASDDFKDQGQYLDLINTRNKLSTCKPAAGVVVPPQRVSDFDVAAPDSVPAADGSTPADVTAAVAAASSMKTIIFTYDVHWQSSTIKWSKRWDLYLKMTDSKIHYFSIINSIMIVLFLSGMVAFIMLRILHRDLTRYNDPVSEEDQKEETGWKLIHGDVFRPPTNGALLAILVGTGVQLFAMTLVTLVFAALRFLSPSKRGGLRSAVLLLFVSMGVLAGYYSTRLYKMFNLTDWKRHTLFTALFFPGILFTVVFTMNVCVWSSTSSGTIPFMTLLAYAVLWLGISVPLVYLGSYMAFRAPVIEHPVKINNLCRLMPPDSVQSWYTHPVLSVLLGGILPFAAVFIEIFFIMTSVWLNQFYVIFGFLFIVFIILILTCAEVTIVLCYFSLCSEDYHWWWRAFLTPASSAIYLYLYSILYFFTRLHIATWSVSAMLYFGYMALVCVAFFVLTGTIGYFACFMFVTKIYASIKID